MPEPESTQHRQQPGRHSARHRARSRPPESRRSLRGVRRRTWLTLAGTLTVVALAAGALAGINPVRLTGLDSAGHQVSAVAAGPRSGSVRGAQAGQQTSGSSGTDGTGIPAGSGSPAAGQGTPQAGASGSGTAPGTSSQRPAAGATASPSPAAATAPNALSSCTGVAHIGDSTSEGMVSADYLPEKVQRLHAQYQQVGVTVEHLDISGARSIIETLPDQKNAAQVATRLMRQGYRGCWVLALGTNDTANVAVGSPISRITRIERMMSVIGNQPVLWVNVISQLSSGPYAESGMRQWNHALLQACASYPNMRVYDWAAAAQPSWFIADGIHYTSAGYAARARMIAGALATAFPRAANGQPAAVSGQPVAQGGGQPSCVVQ